MQVIRDRIRAGIPYVGWSAGSNVCCPTISTTNDMPIVEPRSFRAIGAVKFQINPHYLDANPAGHAGETREQRILEFIEANPRRWVAGLREGCMLRYEDDRLELIGQRPMRIFKKGQGTVRGQGGRRPVVPIINRYDHLRNGPGRRTGRGGPSAPCGL